MSRETMVLAFVMFGVVLAGLGIYFLAGAQGGVAPVFVSVAVSVPVYFLLFDRLFPLVKEKGTEPSPFLATNEARGRVWLVALLISLLGCELITYASLTEEKIASGVVTEKLLKKNKFGHPVSWRIILDNGAYFYVPLSEGKELRPGIVASVAYRDAFFGVRFIGEYIFKPVIK